MTTITGQFEDAGGNPMAGTLRVTLTTSMVNAADNPDSIITTAPREFAISAAPFSVEVPESSTAQVTYRFQFFQTETSYRYQFENGEFYDGLTHLHTDGQYYTGPVHTANSVLLYRISDVREVIYSDFYAQVPNVTTIELSQLVPTGITRDVLDTSIARLAELLTGNEQYVNELRGGPRWQGDFSEFVVYRRDDAVAYQGSSWLYISATPAANEIPTDENTNWAKIAARGDGGTTGDGTPYNAIAWNGDTAAPSKDAVRDVIETLETKAVVATKAPSNNPVLTGIAIYDTVLIEGAASTVLANTRWTSEYFARKASPTFSGTPTVPDQTVGDSTSRIANTRFVNQQATALINALAPGLAQTEAQAIIDLAIAPYVITVGKTGPQGLILGPFQLCFGQTLMGTSNNVDYTGSSAMAATFSRVFGQWATVELAASGDARFLGQVTASIGGIIISLACRNNINNTPISPLYVSYLVIGLP